MSSGTENDFSCDQFMAPQPQIKLAALCKSVLTSMFYYIYIQLSALLAERNMLSALQL